MPSLLEALERKYCPTECEFENFDVVAVDTNAVAAGAPLSAAIDMASSFGSGGSAAAAAGSPPNGANRLQRQISLFIPRLSPLHLVPELLVLNDCDIDCAGDFDAIKDKCQRVRELDLAQNKLQDWQEVCHILRHMPRVEFLNLSKNQLMGPISEFCVPAFSNLRGIVLNGTFLDWRCLRVLLEHLPMLEELHLSLNNYSEVLIDTTTEPSEKCSCTNCCDDCSCSCSCPSICATNKTNNTNSKTHIQRVTTTTTTTELKRTAAHKALKELHFTGNPIESWHEICRLGRVFPKLEHLVLADCPIKSILHTNVVQPEQQNTDAEANIDADAEAAAAHAHFPNLLVLNLSCANLNTWDDIDRLAKFPKLHNLRVKKLPLWERLECTEHERRQLLIARLPNVTLLNGGGVISADEREDAERAFIRYYMEKPECERPRRYHELIAKHGQLDPLVNISLKPEKRVKIMLTYNETSEPRLVDIHRTVADLKVRLEKIVGLSANKMRLYYLDQDYKEMGPEEMKYPNKMLYSYNIQAGDEIIVDEKK